MNHIVIEQKTNWRIYLVALLIIVTLFIPYFSTASFKIEWFIIILPIILIDFLLVFIRGKSISFDKTSKMIFIFIYYNLLLFLINFLQIEKGIFIGFAHFVRASAMLFFYIWINNTFDQLMLRKLKQITIKILFVFALIINIDYFIFQKIISWYGISRLEFINLGTNSLGYLGALSLIFIDKNIENKIMKFFTYLLFINILVLTGSEAAILALLLIGAYRFYNSHNLDLRIGVIIRIIAFIIFIIIVLYFGNQISNTDVFNDLYLFFQTTLTQGISNSTESVRFSAQTYFLRNPNWNPIFGNYYYDFFSKFSYTMHSQFFQILNDIGIIGLFIFSYIIYLFFSKINFYYYEFFLIVILYSFIENFFFQFIPLLLLFVLINLDEINLDYIKENYNI